MDIGKIIHYAFLLVFFLVGLRMLVTGKATQVRDYGSPKEVHGRLPRIYGAVFIAFSIAYLYHYALK